MKTQSVFLAMLKADFLERTRRPGFLVTVCLVIYLGYAVNTGQVLILLGNYRGIYNSAWVGSLMALVITFFLGLFGFFLVKDAIQRDENSGVGQIIAATSLNRPQYLLGKWVSNFALLAALVLILAFAALLMQCLQSEAAQIDIWALTAPLLLVALPMMALVAALAVFFETAGWLKGGFGNLVYFVLFSALFMLSARLAQTPWLDVTGISLIGADMRAAARAAFPDYDNRLLLGMMSTRPLATFVYSGVTWTATIILQRLAWLIIAAGVALSGALFFNRFDPSRRVKFTRGQKALPAREAPPVEEPHSRPAARLTPLIGRGRFRVNLLPLVRLETMLLVKGQKWYWLAGMAVLWLGCAGAPSENYRKYFFMLAALWPVLVWSRMGERDAHYHTGQLVNCAAHAPLRLLCAAWLAGVLFTCAVTSGVLVGRLIFAEPLHLSVWILAVLFIPTLALTLGVWANNSRVFEVVYPILWYLGPFNIQNQLSGLDYLGLHAQAPGHTAPLLFTGFVALLLMAAHLGRRRPDRV